MTKNTTSTTAIGTTTAIGVAIAVVLALADSGLTNLAATELG